MFSIFNVRPHSRRCASLVAASIFAGSLSLTPWMKAAAQNAQQATSDQSATSDQAAQLPAISVTAPPPRSRPTTQASGNAVVVSPTTQPTPSDQSPSSTTVITAADIEAHHYSTLPDALATVPGLNVVQAGGPGGLTSVFMRGTNSNHVKVLIDGIDASDPSNATAVFDFGQLLTGDIERIEILRGPQSGLYGSDAIGGVISITTKAGSGPPKLTFSTEGGSYGTTNERASLSGSQEDFNYVFNLQHFQSISTPVTPSYDLQPGEQAHPNFYNNWTASTKLGAKITDTLSFNLVSRYTDSNLRTTGDNFLLNPVTFAEPFQTTSLDHQFYGRAEAVWSPTATFKNFFGVNYTNSWSYSFNPNMDTGLPNIPVNPPFVNLGTRLEEDYRGELQVAPGQLVLFGAQDMNETFRTNSTSSSDPLGNATYFETSAERRNDAGWLELQNQITKQLYLTSNVRYDANQNFGGHWTYRVAPVYIVPETDTKLKASYGTGFKAPSLYQLYASFPPFFVANPNLKPEESTGYDVGFEQPIANGAFRFGSTYFRNDIKNLIVDNAAFTTLINIGNTSAFGTENFAAWQVNKYINLRADYTYTVAKANSQPISCPPCAGQQLLRRPKNKASLTAEWQVSDRLSFSGTLLYVGSWWDVTRQGFITPASPFFASPLYVKAPGFTTVNLAANYLLRDDVTLFGKIDNLLNKQYEDPLGFMRPGFGIYGGVKVSFGGEPSGGAVQRASTAANGAGPSSPSLSPRSQGVN